MRDLRSIPGRKRRVPDVEAAHAIVAARWPGATREGSLGAWSWTAPSGEPVAEAWIVHSREGGWWLRVLGG